MRKEAIKIIYDLMSKNKNIIFLTADLGYYILDDIKKDFNDRFINVGAAEQLLLGSGVGLALSGKIPICYSITPFLLYRPFEIIRNYIDHEKIPVKLIGSGRDKDYIKDGFSHWACEDKKLMKLLPNITCFHPKKNEDLIKIEDLILSKNPVYINLQKK